MASDTHYRPGVNLRFACCFGMIEQGQDPEVDCSIYENTEDGPHPPEEPHPGMGVSNPNFFQRVLAKMCGYEDETTTQELESFDKGDHCLPTPSCGDFAKVSIPSPPLQLWDGTAL